MNVKRAYHGVAAVQNGTNIGAWEIFAVGGSARSSPTSNKAVLERVTQSVLSPEYQVVYTT